MEKLALVMPAYNEAECIAEVVDAWLKVFESIPGKMIVVNDGSRDATQQILDKLAAKRPKLQVVHQANAGHGAAVLRGYETAIAGGFDWVFQTDSDDQFEAADFWKLWQRRNDAQFLLGIRAQRHDPRTRKVISRTAAWLMGFLFGVVPRDANCPFRLVRAPLLKGMLDVLPRGLFAPNIFITLAAKIGRVPMLEIPVTHRERQTGVVSILRWKLLKVCLRTANELWKFRVALGAHRTQITALPNLSLALPPQAPAKKAMKSVLKTSAKLPKKKVVGKKKKSA